MKCLMKHNKDGTQLFKIMQTNIKITYSKTELAKDLASLDII